MQKKIVVSLVLLQIYSLAILAETLHDSNSLKAKISTASETALTGRQPMHQTLQQSQWQLVSYHTSLGMKVALAEHPATMLFSGLKVSGSTGCNQYFSAYQLINQSGLQFSQSGSTMMACQADIAEQEQQFLHNLAEIRFYHIQGEQLKLIDVEQQVRMTFNMMSDLTLEGNAWQVTGINNGHGGVVSNAYTKQAYLQFTEGKLQGSSGCNILTASYQIEQSAISIGPVSSTRKFCVEEGLMTQEQLIVNALTQVTHFEIRTKQLRLVNASGSLMISLKPKD